MKCISCGVHLESGRGAVRFTCPECGEGVGRCGRCKNRGTQYRCKCGFEGP